MKTSDKTKLENRLDYIKNKLNDKQRLESIIKELDILKELEESINKEKSYEIEDKLNKEIENKKEFIKEIEITKANLSHFNKYSSFDKNIMSYDRETIIEKANEFDSKLNDIEVEIESYNQNEKNYTSFEEIIRNEEDNIEDINNRIKDIEFKILTVKELENECKLTSNELYDIGILRQIVNKILPARVLSNLIDDIENDVNRLLNGFMNIQFDKTDNGLRIICNLTKGNDNISNDLSQGEKSMLSIALLFAIKKYIPWSIISIDEGSAAFDSFNKSRFIDMIESYSNTIDNLNQIFIVSHDHLFDEISTVIDLS